MTREGGREEERQMLELIEEGRVRVGKVLVVRDDAATH